MEAKPDGSRISAPLGTVYEGKGSDARAHSYSRSALVGRRSRRQETCTSELHPPFTDPDPISGGLSRIYRTAGAPPSPRLFTRSFAAGYLRASRLLAFR